MIKRLLTLGFLALLCTSTLLRAETDGTTTEGANLEILFPGLSPVHVSVHKIDGLAGQASGDRVSRAGWKSDQVVIPLPRQHYDVKITHNARTIILDDIDCSSGTCRIDDLVSNLTVNFPGLKAVHTSVFLPNDIAMTAGDAKVAHANWKTDLANITVLRGRYDLTVKHGAAILIVDDVDCTSSTCNSDNLAATLTIDFPQLSAVHSTVLLPDAVDAEASGAKVTHANWKNDQAVISVLRQVYDVAVRHGAAERVIDNVDCRSGSCNVNNLVATLNVNFPGLSPVHTSVAVPDGINGETNGLLATYANWKKDTAAIPVLRHQYDLLIRHGAASMVVDDVDCRAATCSVDNLVASLTVNFLGLSAVHSRVYTTDSISNSATGEDVTKATWKTDQAVITVLRQRYDLSVEKGGAKIIVDGVDCHSGSCMVNDLVANLTVHFPGMSSVHTNVLLTDGIANQATGAKSTHSRYKNDTTSIPVLRQHYDLAITKGAATMVVDGVDCTAATCLVEDLVATMMVKFPGLSATYATVFTVDGDKTTSTDKVTRSKWSQDETQITVFRQLYDVLVSKGAGTMAIDDVDCTSGSCIIEDLVATLTVDFPGLSAVHTTVLMPDDVAGETNNEKHTHARWKNDQASISVLRNIYDLKIERTPSTIIIDNVDCRSGQCAVGDLVATLRVDFPGLSSVHTSVRIPDDQPGEANGVEFSKANWRQHYAEIPVFKDHYDVSINHGMTSIFDDIDCNTGSCNILVEGNAQVQLIDADTNLPIIGQRLNAYEKLADGTTLLTQRGTTNEDGKIHYSLAGLGQGQVFFLKTYNPFGDGKTFYSPILTQTGAMTFRIQQGGQYPLDLVPPQVAIIEPSTGTTVSMNGFNISGLAQDNNQVEHVRIHVADPLKGTTEITANYNMATQSWQAQITPAMITVNQQINLTATATDRALNQHTATVSVSVISDSAGPDINILSHLEGDNVAETGFLLTGTVTDETAVASLTATVDDPLLGRVIDNRALEFSGQSGAWTLAVQNGQLSLGETISLSLSAQDSEGNTSEQSITLQVVAVDNSAIHMINRITFGATPELMAEVETLGPLDFLEQQLAPNMIDDSAFEQQIAESMPSNRAELQRYALMHMIYSKRQLQEVMTWFWDNHFNTHLNTSRNDADGVEFANSVAYELAENNQFRANALGNFRQLLGISAKSPSMLIYLDSISNVAEDANENYAREVMELHTLGVDGGYSEDDVAHAAEVLTGWTIRNNAFFFDASRHNSAGQSVLGSYIPAGGVEQGEHFLDLLAQHSSTARYICSKLLTLLVSDTPPASLLGRCATTFAENSFSQNQIEVVLREILTSPEFNAEYRSKIKTPVELIVSVIRNLSGSSDASDLPAPLAAMGLRLFENPSPTGWSEIGEDWISSNTLLERIKWVNRMVHRQVSPGSATGTFVEPLSFFPAQGFETSEGIVNYTLLITLGDDYGELERLQLEDILNGFDITAPDADERLRRLQGTVLSFPQYQMQ